MTATFNENGNIQKVLSEVWRLHPDASILVVDDSSTDGTAEYLKQLSKQERRLMLVTRKSKLGIGSAHRIAFEIAGQGTYDRLVTMDADLSHNPSEIAQLIEKSKYANYVVGTRASKCGGSTEYKLTRKILSTMANKACSLIIPCGLSEFTTSFRCYDQLAIKVLNEATISSTGYSFFIEVTELLFQAKLLLDESSINFRERKVGKSKIPKLQIMYSFLALINLWGKRFLSRKVVYAESKPFIRIK